MKYILSIIIVVVVVAGCHDEPVIKVDDSVGISQPYCPDVRSIPDTILQPEGMRYDTVLIPVNPHHYKGWHWSFMQGRDWDAVSIIRKNVDDSGLIRSVLIEVRRPVAP